MGGVVVREAGKVAASVPQQDQDYARLFGSPEPGEDGPEYRAMFGTVEEGQRVADARNAAVRDAAPQTGDEAFEKLFGKGGSR